MDLRQPPPHPIPPSPWLVGRFASRSDASDGQLPEKAAVLQLHWSLPLGMLIVGIGFCSGASAVRAAEPEQTAASDAALHERIDQLIEASAVGPLAPRCSDADFLRRIYLDLTGVIPTASQVRAFLANDSPEKRQRVIDELLESPAFSRHMAVRLDVMLLERQTDTHIESKRWKQYLIASIADRKPLDQLFRELIAGDRLEPEARAATKFVLNRDAEPNALTRDIGRLWFGMDLQCAQCHDHPLIRDYYQRDYHGLFALVHRTSLVTDAESKQARLSEKAGGETSFTSVFTGDGLDPVIPRLPKGKRLFAEPTFAEDDQYSTKPDKGVAGVPKYSRREALAERIAESRHFQRNLANRLWAHMFGRGLVHPVDFHHRENPPANAALLKLLADELASGGFQLREMLRQFARTRAYQRSCDAPQPETVNFADIAARGERLSRRQKAAAAAVESLEQQEDRAEAALNRALEQNRTVAAKLPELEKSLGEARQALEKAQAAKTSSAEALAQAQQQHQAVAAALARTREAVAALPDEEDLADAAAILEAKAKELTAASERAKASVAERTAETEAARQAVSEAEKALADATATRVAAEELAELEQTQLAARRQLDTAIYVEAEVDRQLDLCEAAANYNSLVKTDPAAAEAAWRSLLDRWTVAGQLAALRPLSSEQMALSAMRATGMLAPQQAAVEAKLEESPPEEWKNASDSERPQLRARLLQQRLLEQLRGTVKEFVTHYGGLPGEDFQATANQALFFGNSSTVQGWLNPAGENLAARLAAIEDPNALAEELYLAVLSRPPHAQEIENIAARLSEAEEKRPQAIRELIWALLSSTEFRFDH